jgi:hypothetical protein
MNRAISRIWHNLRTLLSVVLFSSFVFNSIQADEPYTVTETDTEITIDTPQLQAKIMKRGYVSGVAGGSLLDKKTGSRDIGFGLDIADWIMEPGSDEAYRDQLPKEMVYEFNNSYHGKGQKRSIEGPQICTQAKELKPTVIRGPDFVAIEQSFRYRTAAPGKKTGSTWTQTIVFPVGKRYFLSCDRIDAVNSSDAMFLRIDMPGHIKHAKGDTFSQVYLSYPTNKIDPSEPGVPVDVPTESLGEGQIVPSAAFAKDFAPDAAFNYRRNDNDIPARMIRGYRTRNPKDGNDGPWLAGLTLDPGVVSEAWCHQRGYICMIQEFGGRPIGPGQSFSAAFATGFFDSIEEMHAVYDELKGNKQLKVDSTGWKLE